MVSSNTCSKCTLTSICGDLVIASLTIILVNDQLDLFKFLELVLESLKNMSMQPFKVAIYLLKHNFIILLHLNSIILLALTVHNLQKLIVYFNEVERLWFLVLVKSNRVVSDGGLAEV
jgi:hypothetical protein